jgi:DNA-binding PadR family transcriptional regulator
MRDSNAGDGAEARLRLASTVFYILVSLAAGPKDRRAIVTEARRVSVGTVSERTILRLLTKARELNVVTETPLSSPGAAPEFELTSLGTALLREEVARLRSLIDRIDVQAICHVASRTQNH